MFKDIFNWFTANRAWEWLFSGIGVFILTFLSKLFFAKQRRKEIPENNYTPENKLEELNSQRLEIVSDLKSIKKERKLLKENYNSQYGDLLKWLTKNRTPLLKGMYDAAIDKTSTITTIAHGYYPRSDHEKSEFKINLSQYIDQLEVCLLEENREMIEEPYFDKIFDLKVYKKAFAYLKKRVPDSVAENSREEFVKYINYLLKRI